MINTKSGIRISRLRLLTSCLLLTSCMWAGETTSLHVLFTNDIHGAIHPLPARFMNPEFGPMLSGGAGAYKYVQQLRSSAESTGDIVLLLDGGNIFQGTPLGTNDGGATIISWMNWMGYDALTPGLKDFDQGVANLRQLAKRADFPFLSGNIHNSDGTKPDWLKPYIFKEIDGLKIAVVGISSATLPSQTFPAHTAGLQFSPDVEAAQALVNEVRVQGADLVIMLAHMGIPYDREEVFEEFLIRMEQGEETSTEIAEHDAMALAHLVTGIDVIVTGGVSKGYDFPWEDPLTHTLVVQNYGNLTGLGHLELIIDNNTRRLTGYQYPTDRGMMVSLLQDDIWPDPEMADSIAKWLAAADNLTIPDYSATIGKLGGAGDCSGATTTSSKLNLFDVPILGDPDRLEVITWNLEWFPAAGDTTLRSVAEIVSDWQVDIVAFQEIKNIGEFARLMELLPDHDFVISEQSSFMDQAIVYRKDVITYLGHREPFASDDYYYAGRPPLMVDFYWHCGSAGLEFSLINMHLKCCGDGLYRRQQSLQQLHGLLTDYLDNGNENIIVVGDWNDDLADKGIEQSFTVFLEDRDNFRFATEAIYQDVKQASYPSWPSFLDHILYARGFFDEQAAGGRVETLKPEDYVGSWEIYEATLSDHRPVLWSVPVKN